MKLKGLLVLSLFFVLSCTVTEKPEFINVNSVKIISANVKEIILQTDLQFLNKNSVGGKLQAKNIKIYVDSLEVGTMQTTMFDVPKKNEFTIPLKTTLSYNKVFNDKNQNVLGSIMNMVMRKKILVQFKGDIRYKLGAFHYDYPLDYTENIAIQIK